MALETEALFLKKAVRAGVLDPEKGTAALYVYSQLRQMGAQFSFGQFLADRGLLSQMALAALEDTTGRPLQTVSQLGDYELVELIGEGENGVVYRAHQVSLDRMVALKILSAGVASDPDALQRFQTEARATARLNHPNIVQGIDVGEDSGLHYFAMELVDGGSARTLMESSGGHLDEPTALRIAQQAAEGLKAAHAAGFLHRDLKPDNILLTPDGQAKVVDLGLAQSIARSPAAAPAPPLPAPRPASKSGRPMAQPAAAAQAGADTPAEKGGEFWASAPYVAPEIITGASEHDPRSDVYSLGATLFELLAGRPPYVGNSPQEVLQGHLHMPVPDLLALRPDVSIQTASLVRRMLAKNPQERVPSAAAVTEAIARLLAARAQPAPRGQAAAARPPSGAHLPKPPSGVRLPRPPSGVQAALPRPGGLQPGRFKPSGRPGSGKRSTGGRK